MAILMTSTVKRVLSHVEQRTGIGPREMTGFSRRREIVAARWRAMRILRRLGYSLPQIGGAFNRDHATVFYAVRGGRRPR